MMERYGDFFSGSDFDLDQTLVELGAEPVAAAGTGQTSVRSLGRKSAGPAVLSQIKSGAAKDAPAGGPQRIAVRPRRRRTLAPGHVCSPGACMLS